MEHEHCAVLVGDVTAELGHPGQEACPLLRGEGGAPVQVAVEVGITLGQDHEVPCAIWPDDRHLGVDVRLGLVERSLALVEGDEDRAAGKPEAALRIFLTDDARIRRQVP